MDKEEKEYLWVVDKLGYVCVSDNKEDWLQTNEELCKRNRKFEKKTKRMLLDKTIGREAVVDIGTSGQYTLSGKNIRAIIFFDDYAMSIFFGRRNCLLSHSVCAYWASLDDISRIFDYVIEAVAVDEETSEDEFKKAIEQLRDKLQISNFQYGAMCRKCLEQIRETILYRLKELSQ